MVAINSLRAYAYMFRLCPKNYFVEHNMMQKHSDVTGEQPIGSLVCSGSEVPTVALWVAIAKPSLLDLPRNRVWYTVEQRIGKLMTNLRKHV